MNKYKNTDTKILTAGQTVTEYVVESKNLTSMRIITNNLIKQ